MSWRRGELWLDTDQWFRGGAGAPAAAVFAPAALPSFGPPPGLLASRMRRAAWKRRRNTRRARATALALSPAVVFMLASLRSNASDGANVVAVEDPPSMTFRLASGAAAATETPARLQAGRDSADVARVSPPASAAEQERERQAERPEEIPAKIDWHRARSIGLPFGGYLVDGTPLPVEGPDWVTWNPVTDSVPNAPKRLYGHDRTIRAVVSISAAYRAAHPHAPQIVVGDISREGGGPMTDEHVSHQNGLDVDIYYPRLDRRLRAPIARDQIDFRLAQDLVDRFVAAGAQMIFVGYSTGLRGPSGVVIPYANHENHMHVRFRPPGG